MSSKPSPLGVRELKAVVAKCARLEVEYEELGDRITADTTRYKAVERELAESKRDIIKKVEGMDCASNGNWGWEARFSWMLMEFERQSASPSPTEHP